MSSNPALKMPSCLVMEPQQLKRTANGDLSIEQGNFSLNQNTKAQEFFAKALRLSNGKENGDLSAKTAKWWYLPNLTKFTFSQKIALEPKSTAFGVMSTAQVPSRFPQNTPKHFPSPRALLRSILEENARIMNLQEVFGTSSIHKEKSSSMKL